MFIIYIEKLCILFPLLLLLMIRFRYTIRNPSFESCLPILKIAILVLSQKKTYLINYTFSEEKLLKRIFLERFVVFTICFKT